MPENLWDYDTQKPTQRGQAMIDQWLNAPEPYCTEMREVLESGRIARWLEMAEWFEIGIAVEKALRRRGKFQRS